MESLRKRVPFNADVDKSNDPGEDNRVLDEQEQEEWIAELRDKADRMDRRIYRQTQVYTGISCLLHVIFFFRLSLLNETPIILARLFALLQVLVHVNLSLVLTPTFNTVVHRLMREVPYLLPLSIPWTLGISGLAPLVSLASNRSWQQTGWWSVTLVITSLVWIMLQSVNESKGSLGKLEKLKYDAKGA